MTAYVEKLERRRPLPFEERMALLSLPAQVVHFKTQSTVTVEGEDTSRCVFALDGLLSRQKTVEGSRQIVSISFPGDALDLQTLFFDKTDHALVTHKQTSLAFVAHGDIIALCDDYPLISKMLCRRVVEERSALILRIYGKPPQALRRRCRAASNMGAAARKP